MFVRKLSLFGHFVDIPFFWAVQRFSCYKSWGSLELIVMEKAETSGKEKAHKHKQIFPVTARMEGGFPTGWPGVSRPVARGQKFMCCVRNPRNINIFVRVPGREDSGTRPGGSVTGVTEKLFMCQMFMCLFRPLKLSISKKHPVQKGGDKVQCVQGSRQVCLSRCPNSQNFKYFAIQALNLREGLDYRGRVPDASP